jgi:thiamine pyrophosphate-dependent acetolactate synthase large subunit-like protein
VFWDGKFQSTDLSQVDFAMVARGLGCLGMNVSEPGDLNEALAQALAADAPAVIDVRTAAGEAAVPKFTESAQARALMQDKPAG